ncbi:hypothetical protein [Pelosinus sp. UFO1]|uniref:hypothetical protein n=1 Tax=Pelosinus sp. UFO1 TaxID=484770 RepID=UPI0004D0FD39|nr:hypothetical protein [Pelosinus sp. UFO1]AIF51824.1 hypothetical protein UFO1_2277 [Pelosinus sp. UFO1]
MKRIFFFLLLILGLLSNVVNAEQGIKYQNSYFCIIVPESWNTVYIPTSIRITSPNGTSSILICPYAQQQISLDEKVAGIEKDYPLFNRYLEQSGNLHIDNLDARFSLYVEKNSDNIKEKYLLNYDFYKDQRFYMIWTNGNYDNLETDRKVISEIVSSLKVLQ